MGRSACGQTPVSSTLRRSVVSHAVRACGMRRVSCWEILPSDGAIELVFLMVRWTAEFVRSPMGYCSPLGHMSWYCWKNAAALAFLLHAPPSSPLDHCSQLVVVCLVNVMWCEAWFVVVSYCGKWLLGWLSGCSVASTHPLFAVRKGIRNSCLICSPGLHFCGRTCSEKIR